MSKPPVPQLTMSEYRAILRSDLYSFFEASFRLLSPDVKFVPGPHLEVLANVLEAVMRGEITRLVINLPPRSLKSHCVSIAFVAWLLGHSPAARIICASYGQDLADKLARDTRRLMNSATYYGVFGTRLSDRQAIHDFETTLMGGRMATSVGGVLTGRGADYIILDDPQKPDETLSETLRRATIEWFQNTLLSRLNDKAKGCIIIVMQRIHEEDLCGHVLQEGGWQLLSFSAITEEDCTYTIRSSLGTRTVTWRKGEALHPERDSLETLAKIRQGTTEYNFSAQYQQRPIPLGGAIVKHEWLKNRYDPDVVGPGGLPPRFGMVVQSWDTANKAGELNDYSVCTTWGILGRLYYLLHVDRKRLTFPELKQRALELRSLWRPNVILVEDKASGVQLIQELKILGKKVTPYKPPAQTDKIMRLHAQTAVFESGHVILPIHAYWLDDYIKELTGFPGTKYADQVDSTTQFLDFMWTKKSPFVSDEVLEMARSRSRSGGYNLRFRDPMGFWDERNKKS